MRKVLMLILATFVVSGAVKQAEASVLEQVQEEGVLRCGVRELGPALSYIDEEGRWSGFYPEICRAIAAAVVSDEEGVEFVVTGAGDRFESLLDDRFDVLVESTTWTLGRDTNQLTFMPLYLFDGQGFLYYKPSGIKNISDLTGKSLCVENHTTSIKNLFDFNKTESMDWNIRPFDTMEGAFSAFFDRQCEAISTDILVTASFKQALAPNPEDYDFIDQRISKEPLSAVVRSGDAQWADVVRWIINAMITAEELGITSENISDMRNSNLPVVKQFLGLEGENGKMLGLDERWAERAIKASGNYGELYEKTLGAELGLKRGINDLWTKGGLIWAPPMR